jgi:uncharacterized membrane protein
MIDGGWFHWVWRRFREAVRENAWLPPAAGAATGFLMAQLVGTGGGTETEGWTVTVDRSRDSLLAGLGLVFTAFSIVLAMASVAAQNVVGRFGSRSLRIYIREGADRWVIGSFSLASSFILVEQFQLRKLDPQSPAPVAGLTISIVLLVFSASVLIWYISAVIRWMRTDRTAIKLSAHTLRAARSMTRNHPVDPKHVPIPDQPDTATDLPAPRSGHLAEIDADALLELCRPLDAMAVISETLAADVVKGQPIGWIAGRGAKIESIPLREIADTIDVSGTRELAANVEYGLVAMVDVAIIALSPAVNDPNTAVEVIEEMTFLFSELATFPLGPYAVPDGEAWPRVVVKARTFGELVEVATTQIVLYGVSDPMVLRALHRFARSLQLLDLDEDDRRHVDKFAESLDAP